MRFYKLCGGIALCLAIGCAGPLTVKPVELLDEHTGITVSALEKPIELVETGESQIGSRVGFAYLGPIEWNRMGNFSYGLWIHVAPGADRQAADIHEPAVVTLVLDDGALVLTPIKDPPNLGLEAYQPAAAWGQTAYFDLTVELLKRMAASSRLDLDIRGVDGAMVSFKPSRDTRAALVEYLRSRRLTGD
jgi:hypothetical protein